MTERTENSDNMTSAQLLWVVAANFGIGAFCLAVYSSSILLGVGVAAIGFGFVAGIHGAATLLTEHFRP